MGKNNKTQEQASKKKLSLLIGERILLLNALPEEGDMVTVMIVKDLKEKIHISNTEAEKVEMKMLEKHAVWNPTKDQGKEIEFSNSEKELLKGVFQKKNEEKKLTEGHIKLYDFFTK